MKRIMITVLAGTMVMLSGGLALAQMQSSQYRGRDAAPRLDQDPRMEQAVEMMFQDMDSNHDGKISKREWQAAQDRQFKNLDKNGDGYITRDEVRADMTQRMQDFMQQQQQYQQQYPNQQQYPQQQYPYPPQQQYPQDGSTYQR